MDADGNGHIERETEIDWSGKRVGWNTVSALVRGVGSLYPDCTVRAEKEGGLYQGKYNRVSGLGNLPLEAVLETPSGTLKYFSCGSPEMFFTCLLRI